MAAFNVPSIGEFDITKPKEWSTWKIRLTAWMAVNKVSGDQKVNALVAMAGSGLVDLLISLVQPDSLTDKDYDELITLIDNYYAAGRNEIAESYLFDCRAQNEGETVAEYVVALRKLSVHCNFGTQWSQRLRNRLVSGVRDDRIRNKLLSEGAQLTWERAVTIATDADVQNSYAMTHSVQRIGQHAIRNTSNPNRSRSTNQQSRSYKSRENNNLDYNRCFRCLGNHQAASCRFIQAVCHKCKRKGHIRKACGKSQYVNSLESSAVLGENNDNMQKDPQCAHTYNFDREEHDILSVKCVSKPNDKTLTVNLEIENVTLKMEIDTGSCITLISKTDYNSYFSDILLEPCSLKFKSASGGDIQVLGKIWVTVHYCGQKRRLCLRVADGPGRLLGRDWLSVIKLDWAALGAQLLQSSGGQVHFVGIDRAKAVEKLKIKHKELFKQELGTLKGIQAHLTLKEGVTPKTTKPYRVPLAMKEKVEAEYDRLVSLGILEKINASEWSSGVVAVPKPGGAVRICGNYKTTVNPALMPVAPPNINIDDILVGINSDGKSKYFTTLDLAQAYNQMVVEESSRPLLALATHKGLYAYKRLAFGISIAPALWQNAMEQVLLGLDRVQVYYDDILVAGRTEEEHLHILDQVMTRLEEFGLRLKENKCHFFRDSVEYLGMVIDENGVRPIPGKVEAVLNTPKPTDVSKLRSYLSMLSYYRRYLPNLATEIAPVTDMLSGIGKHGKLEWSDRALEAFEKSKQLLADSKLLVHFNPSASTRITCDASKDGIAAILSQIESDGTDRPIQFCSRALSKTERMYPQLGTGSSGHCLWFGEVLLLSVWQRIYSGNR